MQECLGEGACSAMTAPEQIPYSCQKGWRPPMLSRVTSCRASGVAVVVCRGGNEVQDAMLLSSPLAPYCSVLGHICTEFVMSQLWFVVLGSR